MYAHSKSDCGCKGTASSGATNEHDRFAFENPYATSASKLIQGHVDGAGYSSCLPLRLLPHVDQEGLACDHPLVDLYCRCELGYGRSPKDSTQPPQQTRPPLQRIA